MATARVQDWWPSSRFLFAARLWSNSYWSPVRVCRLAACGDVLAVVDQIWNHRLPFLVRFRLPSYSCSRFHRHGYRYLAPPRVSVCVCVCVFVSVGVKKFLVKKFARKRKKVQAGGRHCQADWMRCVGIGGCCSSFLSVKWMPTWVVLLVLCFLRQVPMRYPSAAAGRTAMHLMNCGWTLLRCGGVLIWCPTHRPSSFLFLLFLNHRRHQQQQPNCQKLHKLDKSDARPKVMVDLGGYVIILVETKDKKIKLYGNSIAPIAHLHIHSIQPMLFHLSLGISGPDLHANLLSYWRQPIMFTPNYFWLICIG